MLLISIVFGQRKRRKGRGKRGRGKARNLLQPFDSMSLSSPSAAESKKALFSDSVNLQEETEKPAEMEVVLEDALVLYDYIAVPDIYEEAEIDADEDAIYYNSGYQIFHQAESFAMLIVNLLKSAR